jgi:hypothetical protein
MPRVVRPERPWPWPPLRCRLEEMLLRAEAARGPHTPAGRDAGGAGQGLA